MEKPQADQPATSDYGASPAIDNRSAQAAPDSPPAPRPPKWSKTPRRRGRQARDPHAQSVKFRCSSTEEMEDKLRSYLAYPTADPLHATIEFSFPTSAAFMVNSNVVRGEPVEVGKQHLYGALHKTAVSTIDALAPAQDVEERKRKQKAITKTLVETVQKADGFRYCFHNNWAGKKDDAIMFSYFCNDSTLNKGRAANEGAHSKGKSMRKPVYDCEGLVSVKFSATKQSLELFYKHIPLHSTYEERAPPPRKDSKRRKLMEIFNPELLPSLNRNRRSTNGPKAPRSSITPVTAVEPYTGTSGAAPSDDADTVARLVDFLGPAANEPTQSHAAVADASTRYRGNVETPMLPTRTFPQSKEMELSNSAKRSRTALIPKPLSGNSPTRIETEHRSLRRPKTQASRSSHLSPTRGQQEIATVTADVSRMAPPYSTDPTPSSLSELDMLRAKLVEAEQRIQHLEAENRRLPPGPPGWPPEPPGGYAPRPSYPP